MVSRLVSTAIFSGLLGLTVLSSQAEARRLFWWEALPPEEGGGYDIYGDGQNDPYDQNTYADDLFNQEQYDQYMYEMNNRRHRRIFDQSYYDAQPDSKALDHSHPAKPKVLKFRKKAKPAEPKPKAAVAKNFVPSQPNSSTSAIAATAGNLHRGAPKVASKAPAVKSATANEPPDIESVTDEVKSKAAAVSCAKGASIVTSYGFSGVTSKSCTGSTFTYGAKRSGKNFEIQVSASSGELTAVKKL
ncbi:MAG: hypothetical protein KGO94_08005 [Alphaproteobacteria bacterium]|nr:hypothetical protein [Alphaproteobacteria bacterium]